MNKPDPKLHDEFTFNLRGAMAIGSFAAVPVIAHSHINKVLATRFRRKNDERSSCHMPYKCCA